MLIKTTKDIPSSEITDSDVYKGRRKFLAEAGIALGGLVAATTCLFSNPAMSAEGKKVYTGLPQNSFGTDDELTSYEDATSYNNFYELGTGKDDPARNAHRLVTEPWAVSVEGECAKPGIYDLDDILKPHALEERIFRLRCVEAWSAVIPWVGFSLGDLLKRFEPNSHAKFVELLAVDYEKNLPDPAYNILDWPYREGLRMDEAMNPLATLAVGMYGEVLPNQNGAPLRLILPWKYGFKSIKSIMAIRFLREMPETSWNQLQSREYGFYANVNPAVDHPRWSQKSERRLGEWGRRKTLPFNGYAEQVAHLYKGMDLGEFY